MSTDITSATAFSPSLEAIRLAAQMYNAAREGNKQVLEEALASGLPANLTNEKGDTLVSCGGPPPLEMTDSRVRQSASPAPWGMGGQQLFLVGCRFRKADRAWVAYASGVLRPCGPGQIPHPERGRPEQAERQAPEPNSRSCVQEAG